jgi:tetraacyldisaccharide 4'-kinase
LLVDKTNPFGNGFLIHRGFLREPIKHLRRASYVFLTKSDGRRDVELEETIQRHNPGVDIIECAHRPQYLQRFGSDERQPLTYLRTKRVGVFSGIATPESFEKFVRDLGGAIAFTRRFLDHYRFAAEDFDSIFNEALEQKVEFLVITEKDAVRLPEDLPCPVPVYYLRLEIEIIRGAADFDEAVGRICFPQSADGATTGPFGAAPVT